ncbi:MAG: molecular chaperone HtpG [bacterium]|jgi:molecular chaperone HtpG|nr:molecular chaperone HtpG [bacterium]
MSQGTPTKHGFQAEVKQILDIVIHSLYTNRDIFVRELISNATDALEKVRYEQVSNQHITNPDLPLEIRIDVDESGKKITITDTGIGMTEAELIQNLGTIAHSGTREFLQKFKSTQSKDVNLIGQFGVGFYSAFMVAKQVRVQSRSANPEAQGYEWVSDGTSEYSLEPKDGLDRGTKIILELRSDAEEYANLATIKRIVHEYSNLVPFPILINNEKANTIQAIWARSASEVQEEEYTEFYKFIANAYDEPLFRLHFSADAPLAIQSLLFVPQENFERLGFGRVDPGENLYCRRVLIQSHSENVLPEWLRFVKGVVDSEDLPLNISRETMQDNALVRKLKKVVTSRFLKFLKEKAEKEPEQYAKFWNQYGIFLKEGAHMDFEYRDDITALLRFESSKEDKGKIVSLADYFARMSPGQEAIYYLNGPSREAIEQGPYMETFRKRGIEVLYVYEPVDDFVLTSLREFENKKIISADQADLNLPDVKDEPSETEPTEKLNKDEIDTLSGWMKKILGDRVDAVRESKRLVDSPALIVNTADGFTTSMQKVMQAVNKDFGDISKKTLEINPKHPIILHLNQLRQKDEKNEFLILAVEQMYENALVAAGLLPDPRSMVEKNYKILEKALHQA